MQPDNSNTSEAINGAENKEADQAPRESLKILHITRNLPPLVGGMERLNWHMAAELNKTNSVKLVGPSGSAAVAPPDIEVQEVTLRPLWKFLLMALGCGRSIAKRWKPDLVLAGSGLIAPIAHYAARACGAKTVVYVHGLDVAVRNPIYRMLWLPAIRRADLVIANSRPTRALCIEIGVDPNRLSIVYPGVNLPNAGAAKQSQSGDPAAVPADLPFRTRNNLGDRPLLLSVGRLSARKGLREFVEQAMPRIVAAYPDCMLLIVGEAPKDALHAQAQTPESIHSAARRVGVADNLKFVGVITDYGMLGDIYRAADVHVFPVRTLPGDPEGFGMVAVEAASHGLPTVAFATGGTVDAVLEGQSGHLIEPGDYTALADAIIQTLNRRNLLHNSSVKFAQQFAWPNFGVNVAAQISKTAGKIENGDCSNEH